MRRESQTRALGPFLFGTLVGGIGGAALGALLGHRLFASVLHLWSFLVRDRDDEVRFDLLLQ